MLPEKHKFKVKILIVQQQNRVALNACRLGGVGFGFCLTGKLGRAWIGAWHGAWVVHGVPWGFEPCVPGPAMPARYPLSVWGGALLCIVPSL